MICLSSRLRRLAAIAAAVLAFSSFALADSVTGTVTNKTHNKPSSGDEVVLIRLAQVMQESTRTTTNAKGEFTLEVPDPGMHLVRVTHDKASYFRPLPPGTQSVEVEVYDAAAKVAGVSSEADVLRIQTDENGKSLRVVENFWVKNESNPPKTQFSDRPFEFHLPAGAVVEGSAALAPGGMPVQASATPLGDPGHYTFVFPIRPGETRFQITYRLPYDGSMKFSPRPSVLTDTLVVMMPKNMGFKASSTAAAAYSPVTEETTAQTYVARHVAPSQPLDFTVTGSGQLPRDPAATQSGNQSGNQPDAAQGGPSAATQQSATGSAATDTRPGGGLGNPIDPEGTNDPWAKYKWWILGGLGLAMAAGAGFMLKNNPQNNLQPVPSMPAQATAPYAAPPTGGSLLSTLKDELFALETDRMEGRLNETEYAEQKTALEVVLKRALARKEPGPVASKPTEVNPLRG